MRIKLLWAVRLTILLLIMLGLPQICNALVDSEGSAAPVNPEFMSHLKSYAKGEVQSMTEDGYPLGLIPAPIKLSHLQSQFVSSEDQSVILPVSYDLRVTGRVTPVRDQFNCGSCWALASYSSLESSYMPTESLDFSENNLKNMHGFDISCCDGGDHYMTIAYLARWGGPVYESDDPYSIANCTSPAPTSRRHFQEAIFIPDRTSSLNNDLIKQAVMTHGAMYTSMYINSSYYNIVNKAYYYKNANTANHAVCIVGWDDNFDKNKFTTVPSGNGAFIAKNNWGTFWGENGYFYISYYDSKIGRDNVIFKAADSVDRFDRIYQYDQLGWTSSYGYSSNTAWFASVFTASSDAQLAAASWYAPATNVSYELFVYLDPTLGPINPNSWVLKQTGSLPNAGYYTVPLNQMIPLTAGHKFSVVVKLTTPGYNYPISYESRIIGYTSTASANAGESYISAYGTSWTDLTTKFSNASVCLKAFTIPNPPVPPSNPGTADITTSSIKWTWQDNSTNETGFNVFAEAGAGLPSILQATTTADCTSWDYVDLQANTRYAMQVYAENSSGNSAKTSNITRYTLPLTPSDMIVCDKNSDSSCEYIYPTSITFTAINGFGEGSQRAYKYGYLWNTTPGNPANWAGEQFWTSGSLVKTPVSQGNYYLHIRSYNADGLSNPSILNLGPYIVKITCADAKQLDEDVYINLNDKIVTGSFTTDGYLYIEEPNRTSGIRVVTGTSYIIGDMVNVYGKLDSIYMNGYLSERQIIAEDITKTSSGNVIKPLMMVCKAIGGAPLFAGVPGVIYGQGANNIGLLAKVIGKVASIDGVYIHIYDGSKLKGISERIDAWIRCPSSQIPVSVNDLVSVVGIVEGDIPVGSTMNRRLIHIRDWNDLVKLH